MAQQPLPPPDYQDDQPRTVAAAVLFLRKVRVRFQSRPGVYVELCRVLKDYGQEPAAPADPVVHRTAELLRGQHDLIAEFNRIVHPRNRIELTAGDDYDHAAALADANQFLHDMRLVGGDKLHARALAVIKAVHEDKELDAHQVYARLKEVLAGGHPYLLRGIAYFLPKPTKPPPKHAAEGKPEEDHRSSSSSKRKRAALNMAAADAIKPSRAKAKQLCTVAVVELHVNKNDDAVRPSRGKKKPRAADPHTSLNALDDNNGNGDAAAVLPSSAKKSRAAVKRHPLDDGEESDSCWHVTTEDPDDAAATYRKMLEFHAWYFKLVATTRRAEELAKARHPRGALEDLFTDHQCHEILEELFGVDWRTMQVVFDDGGEHVDPTLATMLLLLKEKEDAAVDLVKRRSDKARYGAPADVSDRRRGRA